MTIFTPPAFHPPRLQAVRALIAYQDSGSETPYAFTMHDISPTAKGDRLGPARLLATRDVEALVDALLGSLARDNGYLPADVICHSNTQIAWLVRGRVRPMWFRLNQKNMRLHVPWPHLVLRVTQGTLALAALARGSRPKADAMLYHAPLMNVHETTHLCTGTAQLPPGWSLSQRAQYEAAVFDTNFTHVNHEQTLALDTEEITTAKHLRFWRDLHSREAKVFPTQRLVPLNISVAEWLQT